MRISLLLAGFSVVYLGCAQTSTGNRTGDTQVRTAPGPEIIGEIYKVIGNYGAVKRTSNVKVIEGMKLDIYASEVLFDSSVPKICTIEVFKVTDNAIAIRIVDKKTNTELKVGQLATVPKESTRPAKDIVSFILPKTNSESALRLARLKSLKEQYESNIMYVIGSVVNFRESYTTSSPVLRKLRRGAVVYKKESYFSITKWSKVMYRDADLWSNHSISEDDIDTEEELNSLYVNGWIHNSLLSTRKPSPIVNKNVRKTTILGRWLEVVPNLPEYNHIIVIRRIGRGYVMERHMNDGSSDSSKLVAYLVGGERRFRQPGNTYDEYYVIDGRGGLRMYDREGYIKTASPVKN